MSDWTHGICAGCWNQKNPLRPAEELCVSDADLCCWCGRVTAGGIYLRADGRELSHCAGHPDLSAGERTARAVTGVLLLALEGCRTETEHLSDPPGGWRMRLLAHPDGPGACQIVVRPLLTEEEE